MQPRSLGRPKDLKKRQAILEAAKEIFLELGYESANMDNIAQMAKVSKLTVYNHFQDKAGLFSAAIEMATEQHLPKQYFQVEADSDAYYLLNRLGYAFLEMIYNAETRKMHLLMTSLVNSNPNLVYLFYSAGPKRTIAQMEQFFTQMKSFNLLQIDDESQCAIFFLTLLTDYQYDAVIWKILEVPSPEQLADKINSILWLFFKVYPIIK